MREVVRGKWAENEGSNICLHLRVLTKQKVPFDATAVNKMQELYNFSSVPFVIQNKYDPSPGYRIQWSIIVRLKCHRKMHSNLLLRTIFNVVT